MKREDAPLLSTRACQRLVREVRRLQKTGILSLNPEDLTALFVHWGSADEGQCDYIMSSYFGVRLNPGYPQLTTTGWVVDGKRVSRLEKGGLSVFNRLINDASPSSGTLVGALSTTHPEDGPPLTSYQRVLLDHGLLTTVAEVFGFHRVHPGRDDTHVLLSSPYGWGYVMGRR